MHFSDAQTNYTFSGTLATTLTVTDKTNDNNSYAEYILLNIETLFFADTAYTGQSLPDNNPLDPVDPITQDLDII